MSLLLEVKAVAEYDDSWQQGINFCWLTLENVANSSPLSSALTNWVVALARDQRPVYDLLAEDAGGTLVLPIRRRRGQKGQEVRLFRMFDRMDKTNSLDGTICQFWADLTFAEKKP
jgi:hypothetical protein